MTKYAINQTQTTVGITGLQVEIPIGSWIELSPDDSKHKEVLECERRGWIKLSLTKPGDAEGFTRNLAFEVAPTVGSKTIPSKKKKEAA